MTINYSISPGAILSGWLLLLSFAVVSSAQPPATKPPVVKQINEVALKQLIKPNGKPLLVNFWATWCDPCRDEFPDLVKLDAEYKGKIDFITISLDFPEDINTAVPKFLAAMKAEMPTYVLITPDETAAIGSVNKDWQGGLPFTILYDKDGKMAWVTQKVVKLETIRPEIDKLIKPAKASADKAEPIHLVELPINQTIFTFDQLRNPDNLADMRQLLRTAEMFGALTRRDLDNIDVSRPISSELHLAAEFLLIRKHYRPSTYTSNSFRDDFGEKD